MKKLRMLLMLVLSMAMASHRAMAQEITITLSPGWNWISYPNAVVMGLDEAFGNFTPLQGDMIKSKSDNSKYRNGHWVGGVTQFTPGWGYMYYSSRTEVTSFVFAQPAVFVTTAEPTIITEMSAVAGGTVTVPEGSHVFMRGVCWATEPNPNIDGNHTSEDPGIGSFSGMIEGLNPSTTYYVRAYAVIDCGLVYGEDLSFTTLAEHEYVDLGLPSGVLWAICNLGAETPGEWGEYYAWGETQPKDFYDWSTYQYCMGSQNTLTKYCSNSTYGYDGFTDDLTVLLPEDDAATVNWGPNWRMPTKEEFQELLENTTLEWVNQDGLCGRRFTAENGNSIFLPASGYRMNATYNNVGVYGNYWPSSLGTEYTFYAAGFYFNSMTQGLLDNYRYYGRSVRPVRDPR